MKPIDFPESNGVIGGEIPVNRAHGVVLSRWKATWRERFKIFWYGTIWLSVVGDTMPPTLLSGDQAFEFENPPRDEGGPLPR